MIDLTEHIACREFSDKRKIVVASENNKEYRLINESAFVIEKWKIDNCVFKKETACDYLVIKKTDNRQEAYWVELKGSDIEQAARQILKTIDKIKIENTFVHHARIIPSKNPNPRFRGTKYRELEIFVRNKKGTIVNKNIRLIETV